MTRVQTRLWWWHGHSQRMGGAWGVDNGDASAARLGCRWNRRVGPRCHGDCRGIPAAGAGAGGHRVLPRKTALTSIRLRTGHPPRHCHGTNTARHLPSPWQPDSHPQVATIVLLATTVADDPSTRDARIYLAAGAAVAIAITRAGVRTLPAPISDGELLEMHKPLHVSGGEASVAVPGGSPRLAGFDPAQNLA